MLKSQQQLEEELRQAYNEENIVLAKSIRAEMEDRFPKKNLSYMANATKTKTSSKSCLVIVILIGIVFLWESYCLVIALNTQKQVIEMRTQISGVEMYVCN